MARALRPSPLVPAAPPILRHIVPLAAAIALCALPACAIELPDPDPLSATGHAGSGPDPASSRDGGPPDAARDADPFIIESCFAAGTPVATPKGSRAIESLAVGDAVYAYDTAAARRVVSHVSAIHHHPPTQLGHLQLAAQRVLRVTPEHPVYVPALDRYLPASELSPEHALLDLDGDPIALADEAFALQAGVEPVFNISVEAQHNYFAGGVLVHNKSPPCEPGDCYCPGANPNDPSCRHIIEACFAAGTSIATPTGPQPIEALRAGDEVWAYDTARQRRVARRVTATHAHPATAVGMLTTGDGRSLRVTANHPIYVASAERYLPAGELSGGATLLALDDTGNAVGTSAAHFAPAITHEPVFNLSVDDVHNYFAAGVLVHNKAAPPCPTFNWSTHEGCDHPVVGDGPACGQAANDEADVGQFHERLAQYWFSPESLPLPTEIYSFRDWLRAQVESDGREGFARAVARLFGVTPPTTQAADATLDDALGQQLVRDVAAQVEAGTLRVSTLLGFSQTHLSPRLASFYGAPSPPETDAPVPWPAPRIGLLTEGAFLRAHPTPSARGALLDALFHCGSLPGHTPAMPDPLELPTRRDAYAALSNPALECSRCHASIDPIGWPLEQFDALGVHRPTQYGTPVSSTSVVYGRAVDGPAELARALVASDSHVECLARAMLQEALQRPLSAEDECSVQWVSAGQSTDPDLVGMFLAVLTSPAFMQPALGAQDGGL